MYNDNNIKINIWKYLFFGNPAAWEPADDDDYDDEEVVADNNDDETDDDDDDDDTDFILEWSKTYITWTL